LEERKRLAEDKEAREEQLIQRLGDIALNSENEMAVIAAADKALDRIVGKPVQTTKNENRDMTLEKMLQDAASRGKLGADGA
jgi:hypothetical protein